MPVDFEHIDDFLRSKNLLNPELKVLIPGPDQYKTLAYQHKGDIEASSTGGMYVRNKSTEVAVLQFNEFFKKAVETDANLAITPEYSCPWASIDTILQEFVLPAEGNIWMIGCESITPEEFRQFADSHRNNNIEMIYEENAYNNTENKFLDPIVYILKTKEIGGDTLKTVLIIQFKTIPMGAAFQYEADNMLPGTKRFIIRNNVSSIYLITIICSESLAFNHGQDELNFNNQPYIILHPQLNLNSRAANFIKYRTNLYNGMRDPVKEIVCLNWGIGSTIIGEEITSSRSSIYIKSKAVTDNIDEQKIQINDALGLHYHYWNGAKTGIFIFNYGISLMLYENYKVSQRSEAPQVDRSRRGPQMIEVWSWNDEEWNDEAKVVNLALKETCSPYGNTLDAFLDDDLSAINKERLLCVSTGEIESGDWSQPTKNKLFSISNDEISHRITMLQDPESKLYKERLLARLNSLVSYFRDPNNIPDDSELRDLKQNCHIDYQNDNYSYNVIGDDNVPACLVWAGDIPHERVVALKNDIIESIDIENANKSKRLLIWYTEGAQIKSEYDRSPPKIRDNSSKNRTSYKKIGES